MGEKLVLNLESLYAYLSVDTDGRQGIMGAILNGKLIPLVTGDVGLLVALRPLAEQAARETGTNALLVKFDAKEILETIEVRHDA